MPLIGILSFFIHLFGGTDQPANRHPLPIEVVSSFRSTGSIFFAPEICDNGIDDDLDGFVDAFDTDCPCSLTSYQAYCAVDCEYLPDSFSEITLSLKWRSEIIVNEDHIYPNVVVGDMNHDGIIDVVAKKYISTGGGNNFTNGIATFNGSNGTKLNDFNTVPRNINGERFFISIADVNSDGTAEYFFSRLDTIICMSYDGATLWKSDRITTDDGYVINLADFNGDGIPEIYRGNSIFNAQTGKLLVRGNAGAGCNFYQDDNGCDITNSIAADLLPSPGLELAAGNTVYQINITNINGTAGNSITPVTAPNPIKDGMTSVGDIDGDGELDVVVVRNREFNNGGGVWAWNPRTQELIASSTAGITGGIAFIGNVAGDCKPEIGVNFQNQMKMLSYNGTTTFQVLYNLNTADFSGYTSVTMFDFNQDGLNELIYRDENFLRIMEGSTGITITSYPIQNGTGMEYPLVADVDNDGEAEIIVSGFTTNFTQQRIFCFESGGTPWAPARSVWNQPGYHVTNVNDDLTIPRNPQNQAKPLIGYETCLMPTCPAPYNAFMTQATFRTQQGCVQFPAADLTIDLIDISCAGDSVEICFVIENLGDKLIQDEPVNVSAWSSNPLIAHSNPLMTKQVTLTNEFNTPDTFCVSVEALLFSTFVYLAVNDPGTINSPYTFPLTDLVECIYTNNLDSLLPGTILLPIDLGLDTVICLGDELQFTYSGHYEWISWLPSTAVDCDTCGIVHFISSQSQLLTVAIGNGICEGFDTIDVKVVAPIILETDTSLCFGNSLLLRDSTITTSGNYEFIVGICDSIIIFHVQVFNADTTFTLIMICEGDSMLFNGNWLTQTGMYQAHLINRFGCDSLAMLTLAVEDFISKQQEFHLCARDSLLIENRWIYTAGLYMDTFPGINCDTILSTTIVAANVYHDEIEIILCPGDSIWIDDRWISVSETVVTLWTTFYGCDSIIVSHVIFPDMPPAPELIVDCEEGLVLASIDTDPSWRYEWNNGSTGSSTNYEVAGQGYLLMYQLPDCELRFDFDIPAVPNPFVLIALKDTTLLENHSLNINLGLDPAHWKIMWTPADIFSCPTCINTQISPQANSLVHVLLEHDSGCVYETDFTITLEPIVELYIPNVFSPNGDQVNDEWMIINPEGKLDIRTVFLFDRWGDLIREWNSTNDISWDGTFSSKPLNPGVFTYLVEYLDQENLTQTLTGNVTLLR